MGTDTDELVETLEARGLWIKYRPPDTLLLCGPKAEQTPEVLAQLAAHRPELLRRAREEAGKRVAVPEKRPQPVTAEIEAACERCRATIFFPAAGQGVFCDRTACPHPRLGPEMRRADAATWTRS